MAADVLAIELGSGVDIATATASATLGTPVAFTIAPASGKNVFERNDDICVNLTTDGAATNACLVMMTFENIH